LQARWTAYLVALLAVAAALGLRALLTPWLGERVPYITIFGAVIGGQDVNVGTYTDSVTATVNF